jgi:PilZ domain
MVNVSLSGAFVQTGLKAPLFARVVLTVSLDRKTKAHLEGQIVRQTDMGLGVEWHEFGGEQVLALLASHRHQHAREHHTVAARNHRRPLKGRSRTPEQY